MSDTTFIVDLVNLCKESAMQSFIAYLHELDEEGEAGFPYSQVQCTFVKSGYMQGGFIPTLRYVDIQQRCFRERGDYT